MIYYSLTAQKIGRGNEKLCTCTCKREDTHSEQLKLSEPTVNCYLATRSSNVRLDTQVQSSNRMNLCCTMNQRKSPTRKIMERQTCLKGYSLKRRNSCAKVN